MYRIDKTALLLVIAFEVMTLSTTFTLIAYKTAQTPCVWKLSQLQQMLKNVRVCDYHIFEVSKYCKWH